MSVPLIVMFRVGARVSSAIAFVVLAAAPAPLMSQGAGEHVALGDRDYVALNGQGALRHYEEALKADPNAYDALLKATRAAVDLGEFNDDTKERDRLYTLAEQYARRAVVANAGDAESHFELARALGRKALSVSARERVQYATDVHAQAMEALRLNPTHPGALHVMGMWNYNVMQLNGIARFLARRFLGGKVFDSASWDEAQRYMEESVAHDPLRIVHHLDLARVYAARGSVDRAREQYALATRGTPSDYNDRRYQAEAADELTRLR